MRRHTFTKAEWQHVEKRIAHLGRLCKLRAPRPILQLGVITLLERLYGSVWRGLWEIARDRAGWKLFNARMNCKEWWLRHVRRKSDDEIHVALFGFSQADLDDDEDDEEWRVVVGR